MNVEVRDPLAEFLGAAAGGRLEYSYADAVKLTGHSCPTVAGAWLATVEALRRLYPGEVPERGAIRVELRAELEEGVAGVVASVAGLVTGAAGEGGSVEADLVPAPPGPPDLPQRLRRALSPDASDADRQAFAAAWQARVAEMLR